MDGQTNPYDDPPALTEADRERAMVSLARHLGVAPDLLVGSTVEMDLDRPNMRYVIMVTTPDRRFYAAHFQMRRRYEDHEWDWKEG